MHDNGLPEVMKVTSLSLSCKVRQEKLQIRSLKQTLGLAHKRAASRLYARCIMGLKIMGLIIRPKMHLAESLLAALLCASPRLCFKLLICSLPWLTLQLREKHVDFHDLWQAVDMHIYIRYQLEIA